MKILCLTPENATTNLRVKDNPPKDDSDSTESDSDSNDISDTSGAASTSVNTTFDAEGGDDESDDGIVYSLVQLLQPIILIAKNHPTLEPDERLLLTEEEIVRELHEYILEEERRLEKLKQ